MDGDHLRLVSLAWSRTRTSWSRLIPHSSKIQVGTTHMSVPLCAVSIVPEIFKAKINYV